MIMRPNADCTVYNKFTNGTATEYKRSELKGIMWANRKAVATGRGLTGADSVTAYIPILVQCSKPYKAPKAWEALSTAEKANYWTLRPGDKLVRGIVAYEIPAGTVAILEKTYDDVVTITAVDTNNGGSISLQHYRVGGS
jgi:hypothetical protein